MSIFPIMKQTLTEQLKFCVEKKSNLKAIIAINSTAIGPSLGDITFIPNVNNYNTAISSACFLAQKLTNVYAFLGLHYGGAKIIALGTPNNGFEELYFRSLARHIEKLNGRFIIRSSGYLNKDMINYIKLETQYFLSESIIVNNEQKLPQIKKAAIEETIKKVSQKLNKDINNIKIGFFGTKEIYNNVSHLLNFISNITVFDDINQINIQDEFDIILLHATNNNNVKMIDLFKINFKAAIGVCEEEIDMEVYENVMSGKNIIYIPGYLTENFEVYYFKDENIYQICNDQINLLPFKNFISEKIDFLISQSISKNENITKIINDFAKQRIEMLQLLK